MKKVFSIAVLGLWCLVIIPQGAAAGPATDALSACLADNTTGRDRKDLVRWMFAALSVHPEIKSLSTVTLEERERLDRQSAALLERLMTENCRTQTRDAMKAEGNAAIRDAFDKIGRLAMQELMGDQTVMASFSQFTKYLNQQKFLEAMK